VALLGASERPGALGSIVWRNLAAARPRGAIYP
jgi:acyl-CoA synthetase (NDP forming)